MRYIDLGFDLKIKNESDIWVLILGKVGLWFRRKEKGLAAKARNKELLESGTFKIVSHGTGKFGRVLGEVFVETDNGLQSVNQILIDEGHYEYDGGKKKKFIAEIKEEKDS